MLKSTNFRKNDVILTPIKKTLHVCKETKKKLQQ